MLSGTLFHQIYAENFDGIYRYTLSLSGDSHFAEDVTQECFLHLYQNGVGAGAVREPRRWLFRVARNLAIDRVRGPRQVPLDPQWPDSTANPESAAVEDQTRRRVLDTIARLTPSQRECLTLREYAGLSYREIAELLEISLDQVKVHLHRARQNIREQLEERK